MVELYSFFKKNLNLSTNAFDPLFCHILTLIDRLKGCDQHGDEQERWKRHPLRNGFVHYGHRLGVGPQVCIRIKS